MHRINRIEIELHSGDVQLARALSERVSRMHRDRIAPVIDRVCSELSRNGELIQLDRLEVDLGDIAADDFEEDFAAKLEQALRTALAPPVRRVAGGTQRASAALELLETFALTGGLPWWANPQDGEVVARHFARAAVEAAEELVALLRRIANDPGALERMARTCDEGALVALLGRAPGSEQSLRGVGLNERRMLLSELASRDWRGVPAERSLDDSHPLHPPPSPSARTAARRGMLARLDELYVDDAGVVILWPFLERFFTRVRLLGEDRRFLDETAQLQAVALVEMLATADPAPLEFRLPLAKLLCGRPLESDFHLDRPLTPEQLGEGDHLLAAVIHRAPVLGDLTIQSLRATFLHRPGALSTRDGAWLLQVERRAHDVVLDHFPWSWSWVKLPWMPEPLRVEW